MLTRTNSRPDYGNWVSMKLVLVPALIGLVLLFLSLLAPLLVIVAALFILVSGYFAYARREFSPRGGNVQAHIRELVLSHLGWDGAGEAIDIGCGNGPLTVGLAKRYPVCHVTGIDYWGGQWEYSKAACEKNAASEGVSEQVRFQKASASALPFADECFNAAVSNLVFHEVADAPDKRAVIREALRVVKKGGVFAFQDLFLIQRVYGPINDLLDTIKTWGVERVEFVDTSKSDFIARGLRLPFMVGTIGLLYGRK